MIIDDYETDTSDELAEAYTRIEQLENERDELKIDNDELNAQLSSAYERIGELAGEQYNAFDEYQKFTEQTAIYPRETPVEALTYTALGLASEAGEVAGKMKKVLRDSGGFVDDHARDALVGETGDVLWYVARMAEELGYPLSYIAHLNKIKLTSRLERGVIGGNGDNR